MAVYNKQEAYQDLSRRTNLPVEGGIYEHFKGGFYVVLAVSLMEDAGEILVTYRSNATGNKATRTLEDFQSEVEITRTVTDDSGPREITGEVPRFRRVHG